MNHQAARAALTQASSWRKSNYSIAQNDCVEITTEVPGWVGVRDSKLGASSPLLPSSSAQWTVFLEDTLAWLNGRHSLCKPELKVLLDLCGAGDEAHEALEELRQEATANGVGRPPTACHPG